MEGKTNGHQRLYVANSQARTHHGLSGEIGDRDERRALIARAQIEEDSSGKAAGVKPSHYAGCYKQPGMIELRDDSSLGYILAFVLGAGCSMGLVFGYLVLRF